MPDKEPSVEELKSQLSNLQQEISRLEDKPQKQKAVKSLFRWQSFSRPYSKYTTRGYFIVFLAIGFIVIVILFVREFIIIAPVLAIAFLAYVLSAVKPELIENEITTQGLNIGTHSYIWEEMDDFWFIEKRGHTILQIDTYLNWPRRLEVLVNSHDRDKMREILARYLPYRELPKTSWLDHMADGLISHFSQTHRLIFAFEAPLC